ncbi:MAG: type I-E CRISPR-associated protein Cse1/CasA [Spirochaetota bacterium]
MNLLKDSWLPAIRSDGTKEKIAIWQILDKYKSNPVIDFEAPRPDFRNAIYQLLIGIVQVAALAADEDEWRELWDEPYQRDVFKKNILAYEDCFEIDSDGPAFMQDYSLAEFKEEKLTNIFVELPSNEHFNKFTPQKIDAYWAAITLYALQTFGPAGGRGQKTGLRGGGPLTTIMWPEVVNSSASTLWHKVWMNTLSADYIPNLTGNAKKKDKSDIFPWMKPTKISSSEGSGLYAQECHPFHMFFGMPRRIRLVFKNESGICDISGKESSNIVTSYKQRHSGNDYKGTWIHPLNPYRNDPQKPEDPPYSIKGQPGGILYRYWPRLALQSDSSTEILAPIVAYSQSSRNRKDVLKNNIIHIWAAGFDLSNMKARCWYEATLPIYTLENQGAKELEIIINSFIAFASEVSSGVTYRIKEAWFKSPKDVGGDFSHIGTAFWQDTESYFYALLSRLAKNIFDKEIISECASGWKKYIHQHAITLFETWALSGQEDGLDMKRIVNARNGLLRTIFGSAKKYLNNIIEKA